MTKLQSWFCCSLFFFAACALDEDAAAGYDLEAPLPQGEGETPDIGGVRAPCCNPPPPGLWAGNDSSPEGETPDIGGVRKPPGGGSGPPGVWSGDTSMPGGDAPDISGTRPGGTPPVPQGLLGEPMAGDAPDLSGTRPPGASPVLPGSVAK